MCFRRTEGTGSTLTRPKRQNPVKSITYLADTRTGMGLDATMTRWEANLRGPWPLFGSWDESACMHLRTWIHELLKFSAHIRDLFEPPRCPFFKLPFCCGGLICPFTPKSCSSLFIQALMLLQTEEGELKQIRKLQLKYEAFRPVCCLPLLVAEQQKKTINLLSLWETKKI